MTDKIFGPERDALWPEGLEEDIWALWYGQAAAEDRRRKDAPWGLEGYPSACGPSKQPRRFSWLWSLWTSLGRPARG